MTTFRFYAALNDFLAPALRYRRMALESAAVRSVKDAIEALGVPHPEVDVILVNGESQDFSYRLQPGDDVSVYPVFRALAPSDVRRTSGDPPRPVRFVVDVHLRKLASLLRLCGFDADVRREDAEIAEQAADGTRVALTRDVGLLKRSIVRHGYWARETDPERQLAEVVERFDLSSDMRPFSRCLRCNTPLESVEASAIAGRVSDRTRACVEQFHQCPGCRQIYWKGSHYDRLRSIIERVHVRP